MLRYSKVYASYVHASGFIDLPSSDRALNVFDHHGVSHDNGVGAYVKRWWPCIGRDLSVLRVRSEVDSLCEQ